MSDFDAIRHHLSLAREAVARANVHGQRAAELAAAATDSLVQFRQDFGAVLRGAK